MELAKINWGSLESLGQVGSRFQKRRAKVSNKNCLLGNGA